MLDEHLLFLSFTYTVFYFIILNLVIVFLFFFFPVQFSTVKLNLKKSQLCEGAVALLLHYSWSSILSVCLCLVSLVYCNIQSKFIIVVKLNSEC